MSKIKSLIIAGATIAGSAMAQQASGPSWAPSTVTSTSFDPVLTWAAPIAIAVVVGVAGVRVVIKLINRGAGK